MIWGENYANAAVSQVSVLKYVFAAWQSREKRLLCGKIVKFTTDIIKAVICHHRNVSLPCSNIYVMYELEKIN